MMKEIFEKIKTKYNELRPSYDSQNWGSTSKDFLDRICLEFKCEYPQEFIEFQLNFADFVPMGDFSWDGFGWANEKLEPYMNLYEIVKDAREIGTPDYLSPFKVDNGDFYCFDTRNNIFSVVIWDHNSNDIERDRNYFWPTFVEWLIDGLKNS